MLQTHAKVNTPPLRTTFNLLVSGHTFERLGDNGDALQTLSEVLDAIRDTFSVYSGRKLRIWTGLSEGTDTTAIAWAQQNGKPLYCIAATTSSFPEALDRNYARILAITDKSSGDYQDPLWVQASDDYKLSMADAVVVVWDGEKARGAAGGVVRILAEALRRRVPVLWIDLEGQCRISLRFGSNLPSQVQLDLIDPLVPNTMRPLFDEKALPSLTQQQLMPLFGNDSLAQISDLFDAEDEPGEQPRLTGFWHTLFFRLLTPFRPLWKVKWRKKVAVYRGEDIFVRNSGLDTQRFWQRVFDPLDRVATYAANRYRDGIVLSRLFSSFAVLSAVAGSIGWLGLEGWVWALLELLALAVIGIIVHRGNNYNRGRRTVRDLFLDARRAAEILRISALLYPFLASLPELNRRLWQIVDTDKLGEKQLTLRKQADWLALQALRDAEPPSVAQASQVTDHSKDERIQPYILSQQQGPLTAHLLSFIDDQLNYHRSNAEKTETLHHRLHRLTQWVYFLVLAVVMAHIFELGIEWICQDEHNFLTNLVHLLSEQHWLILVTAFFPALAAALHGILSTLELQRIANSSWHTAMQLEQIKESLQVTDKTPINLRAQALLTAQVTFAEHDSWSNLMVAQNLGIPA